MLELFLFGESADKILKTQVDGVVGDFGSAEAAFLNFEFSVFEGALAAEGMTTRKEEDRGQLRRDHEFEADGARLLLNHFADLGFYVLFAELPEGLLRDLVSQLG